MTFIGLEQEIFKNNLVLIDSLLPNILGEIIKKFYSSNFSTVSDLTNQINLENPLAYNKQFSHLFYEYKI